VVFARKGTSLLFLANKYAISYRQLLTFNHLQEKDLLERDQLIFIQQKRKSSPNKHHVVAAGETLYDIAQKQGVRLAYLYKYNRFNERHQLLTGEIIFLQKKSLVAAIFTAKETAGVPVKTAK
jgi:LysM repeat protein